MGPPPPAPGLLQLAGHPLRWGLLAELARSDRTVQELSALVDQPQNLVSYHLGKLRGARLVGSRRSSADRRDAYYSADLARLGELLSGVGGALHPGLRLDRPTVDPAALAGARVLFLCTGNSARSRLAEALARARSGGAVDARSAGSHPKPLHPNAVRVLREEHGIELDDRPSLHLDTFVGQPFDRVVTVCDRVREVCPELPGGPPAAHWSVADPASGGGDPSAGGGDDEATYPAFRALARELDGRVGFLLAALADRRTATEWGGAPP